jgi:hypothetical protein
MGAVLGDTVATQFGPLSLKPKALMPVDVAVVSLALCVIRCCVVDVSDGQFPLRCLKGMAAAGFMKAYG